MKEKSSKSVDKKRLATSQDVVIKELKAAADGKIPGSRVVFTEGRVIE